jgi:hypothetical protein
MHAHGRGLTLCSAGHKALPRNVSRGARGQIAHDIHGTPWKAAQGSSFAQRILVPGVQAVDTGGGHRTTRALRPSLYNVEQVHHILPGNCLEQVKAVSSDDVAVFSVR